MPASPSAIAAEKSDHRKKTPPSGVLVEKDSSDLPLSRPRRDMFLPMYLSPLILLDRRSKRNVSPSPSPFLSPPVVSAS